MNQDQIASALQACIRAGQPMALLGAPGTGKSALVAAACEAVGARLLPPVYTVCSDPTDAGGVLWPDANAGICRALPKSELATALAATERTVLFLDDFAQASPAVQNSWAHLLYARMVGDQRLPDCVSFIIAANRRSDAAGSVPVVSTIMSRCVSVVTLIPTLEGISRYALGSGWHPAIIAYLRERPDALYTESPQSGVPFPCPRSWAGVDTILRLGLSPDVEASMLEGAVGAPTATEFCATLTMLREKLSADEALRNPKYRLPKQPDQLIALSAACAYAVAADHARIAQLVALAQRLQSTHGEYAAAMLSDLVRRDPRVMRLSEWQRIAQSSLADLMLGL